MVHDQREELYKDSGECLEGRVRVVSCASNPSGHINPF